jgi:hypothetical protein
MKSSKIFAAVAVALLKRRPVHGRRWSGQGNRSGGRRQGKGSGQHPVEDG